MRLSEFISTLIAVIPFVANLHGQTSLPQGAEFPTTLPQQPAGMKWVANETFTDEFGGDQLDETKWYDHNPLWKGRAPGKFMPSSVSVKDDCLQIKSTKLDPPDGEFTIACGAIQSKSREAHYGFYECRVKASQITTSTTFWLKNDTRGMKRPFFSTELDILECIGGAKRWARFSDHMNSNTHVTLMSENKEEKPPKVSLGAHAKINGTVSDGFHTYGCWWIDPRTLKFYLDGKEVYTIEPPTELTNEPFSQPMLINLVCETYNWETPPSPADLADDSRNTTYYDYVRAFKLVPASE